MKEPFRLGFEGEHWHDKLHSLVVPIPHTDYNVLVQHASSQDQALFTVITINSWVSCDHLLMCAAMVQHKIEQLTSEGKDGSTKVEGKPLACVGEDEGTR
jgi:hypothetical protein